MLSPATLKNQKYITLYYYNGIYGILPYLMCCNFGSKLQSSKDIVLPFKNLFSWFVFSFRNVSIFSNSASRLVDFDAISLMKYENFEKTFKQTRLASEFWFVSLEYVYEN